MDQELILEAWGTPEVTGIISDDQLPVHFYMSQRPKRKAGLWEQLDSLQ